MKIKPIINASLGFSGYLWEVSTPEGPRLVHACDNYTAAEATGQKFGQCKVRQVPLGLDLPADENYRAVCRS